MAKSSGQLNEQVKAVNKELSRLGLQEVTGGAEVALVDSAYDQMGYSTFLQQIAVTVSVLLGVTSFLFSLELEGWNIALGVVMVTGLILTLAAFPVIIPGHQSAKAVELIVMHRANRPDSCKPET